MTARVVLPLVLAAVAPILAGCGNEKASVPPPVESSARQIAQSGAESVIVFVATDGDEYDATAGKSPPAPDQRFRVGSVTKTFTAAVVLQLVDEGTLRLDDTLDEYVPGAVPRGDEITIRYLLSHRSGLVNFTDDRSWLEEAGRSPSTRPLGSLRFAGSQPLVFEPGSQESYSNTNYIALGLIIEKATGESYAHELEQRILDPLELDRTELATTRLLPDLDDDGENPNLPWAAGSIVSTTHDLSRFFSALLSGEIVSEASLAEMKRPASGGGGMGAGLGIFPSDQPCGRHWGHAGGILDYLTLVTASEDGDRVLVISIHGGFPENAPDEGPLLCDESPAGR
jgi:D-alanyl-D-alanine carboxypeptidase